MIRMKKKSMWQERFMKASSLAHEEGVVKTERMNEQTLDRHRQTDGRMAGRTDRQTYRCTDGLTGGWTDGRTDGWI